MTAPGDATRCPTGRRVVRFRMKTRHRVAAVRPDGARAPSDISIGEKS